MEKIDLSKFVKSFGQVVPWLKTGRVLIGILIIFFVGITIYRGWFMATNKTKIVAKKGSNVTVIQQTLKKKRFALIPFIEGDVFAESGDRRGGVGARAGVRLEF